MPLLFASRRQVNAEVPFDVSPGAAYHLVVQHETRLSVPQDVTFLDADPAIFTVNSVGTGQGHVYRIMPTGEQILAAPSAPVTAGDVLTIYCAGLGEVSPPVDAGAPAPLDRLEPTANAVAVTVGGVNAQVLFAGLTPGFTGLYQVNVVVPKGVMPADDVPVVITVAGQAGVPVTIAMR